MFHWLVLYKENKARVIIKAKAFFNAGVLKVQLKHYKTIIITRSIVTDY